MGTVELSGQPFNDAYRYVDWLLTVPLLLMELILVMGLEPEETASLSLKLGVSSALVVGLGHASFRLRCLSVARRLGYCHQRTKQCVCKEPHQCSTNLDGCVLVDIPRCVHHQDDENWWPHSERNGADWILGC